MNSANLISYFNVLFSHASCARPGELMPSNEADEAAGRIGAIGGNLGVGAEVRWKNGLGLGIRTDVVITRFDTSNAQTQTVSSLIRPRTALTVSTWF